MDEYDLKKISRKELLELLIEQTERIETLEKELAKANSELQNRKIDIENCGSIAEASLRITGIFNKAQEACDIYKKNVIKENKKIQKEIRRKYEILERKKYAETEKICNKKIKLADKKLLDAEKRLKTKNK